MRRFKKLIISALWVMRKKRKNKCQYAIQSWIDSLDVIYVYFKISTEIRKIIYTTNAMESLNSSYKRIKKIGMVF